MNLKFGLVYILVSCFNLQKMLHRADDDDDAQIDFAEFVKYMRNHEQNLRLAFSSIDKNKDGKKFF